MHCKAQPRRIELHRAFTIVELLVACTVIAVLLAILVPAIQMVRESARRAQCKNNLHQLSLATQSYYSTYSCFPPGNANGWSTQIFLLPHLEQGGLYRSLAVARGEMRWHINTAARPIQRVPSLAVFQCPSDSFSSQVLAGPVPATSYCGNWGMGQKYKDFNGVFTPLGLGGVCVTEPMIDDGFSNTACFAEILVASGVPSRRRSVWELPRPAPVRLPNPIDRLATNCMLLTTAVAGMHTDRGRPWDDGNISNTGYTHLMPPGQPNCLNGTSIPHGGYSAGSEHGGGAQVVFADGHIRFVSESINLQLWRSWGTRAAQDK